MATSVLNIKSAEWQVSAANPGAVVEGDYDIAQSIMLVLNTMKGSDPFRPGFGCDILSHVDKPALKAAANISREILTALTQWVSRIQVTSITYEIVEYNIIFEIGWVRIGARASTAKVQISLAGAPASPVIPPYKVPVILLAVDDNTAFATDNGELIKVR